MVPILINEAVYCAVQNQSLPSSESFFDGGIYVDILKPTPNSSSSVLSMVCGYGELDEECTEENCVVLRITLSKITLVAGSKSFCFLLL